MLRFTQLRSGSSGLEPRFAILVLPQLPSALLQGLKVPEPGRPVNFRRCYTDREGRTGCCYDEKQLVDFMTASVLERPKLIED